MRAIWSMLLIATAAAVSLGEALGTEDTVDDSTRFIVAVSSTLKDPDSAKFKGIGRGPQGNLCGMVNSKNSMGGYVGFQLVTVYADGKAMVNPYVVGGVLTISQACPSAAE